MRRSYPRKEYEMSDDYETHELEMAFKAGAASRDAEIAELVAALEDAQWDEDGWKLKVANLLAKVRKP